MHQFMLPHIPAALASVVQGPEWTLSASPFLFTHFYILVNERQPNEKQIANIWKTALKSSAVRETTGPQWGRTACPQSLCSFWAPLGEIFSFFRMNPSKGENPPSPKRLMAGVGPWPHTCSVTSDLGRVVWNGWSPTSIWYKALHPSWWKILSFAGIYFGQK